MDRDGNDASADADNGRCMVVGSILRPMVADLVIVVLAVVENIFAL
jgi:hypothetical protein